MKFSIKDFSSKCDQIPLTGSQIRFQFCLLKAYNYHKQERSKYFFTGVIKQTRCSESVFENFWELPDIIRLYLVKLHRTCQVFTKKKSTTYNQIRDLRNFRKFSDQLFDCPPLKSCFQKRLTAVLAPEPQRNVIPSMILTRYVNFII